MCKRPVIINIINAKKCDLAMQKKIFYTNFHLYFSPYTYMIDQNKIKFYYKINVCQNDLRRTICRRWSSEILVKYIVNKELNKINFSIN